MSPSPDEVSPGVDADARANPSAEPDFPPLREGGLGRPTPLGCALNLLALSLAALIALPRLAGYAQLRFHCGRDRGLVTWVMRGFPEARAQYGKIDYQAWCDDPPRWPATPTPRRPSPPDGSPAPGA